MRWCANHYLSRIGHRRGLATRCSKPFANSRKNNSWTPDGSTKSAAAHARYFASRESNILALWDSPQQRESYEWFTTELPNLRAALRWAADNDDLDTAAAIAVCATFLGFWIENFEPVAWAEELVEPARAVDHRRLAQLYAMATQCYAAGRLDDALGYVDAGRLAIDSGRYAQVPYDFESWLGGPYIWKGVPEQWLELCRNMIAQGRDTHYFAQANLVIGADLHRRR